METGRLRLKETWMIHEEIFQWGETFPYKECLPTGMFLVIIIVLTIYPKEWWESNFSLKYHPWIKQ